MVRAILDGSKTQTRRVVKDTGLYAIDALIHGAETVQRELMALAMRCPYGVPGSRLWVRETWAETDRADGTPVVAYRAGGCIAVGRDGIRGPDCLLSTIAWDETPHADQWRPSIHMPRWASRILLEVTGVRVERLQEISVRDCVAEGIPAGGPENPDGIERTEYCALWEQINGPGSWEENPWVWCVSFRRIKP